MPRSQFKMLAQASLTDFPDLKVTVRELGITIPQEAVVGPNKNPAAAGGGS